MNSLRAARGPFSRRVAVTGALAGAGDLAFLSHLPRVSAAEAKLPTKMVQLHPEIEPLVRLLENTPRERTLEEMAAKIRSGTSYREIVAALFLAGVRNIQPRPVGFKFHAVMVVNAAHLAGLASPDTDRWLPIFWAIDNFKNSQAEDVRQGDWTLLPVNEAAVPPARKARQALLGALDGWDEAAADAAIVGMCRSAGADEIFEILSRYGARDFRELGHKEIYTAGSFRCLGVIGWHHAEPILRSLVYAMLDRVEDKDVNPGKADLPADRPFRRNLERAKEIRTGWLEGKPDAGATREMLVAIRNGSADEAGAAALRLLNKGVAPGSLFDGYRAAAGELMMRQPGILAIHAATFTNACHFAFQHCGTEETRKLLLLQNAAFLPLYREGAPQAGVEIDRLAPITPKESGARALDEIFADVSGDKTHKLQAAQKILAHFKNHPDPKPFAAAARRLIFLKGGDAHDYKFSSAVLEDRHFMSPPWRDRCLAAAAFNLKGSGDPDNDLAARTRAAFTR